jgi:integrase
MPRTKRPQHVPAYRHHKARGLAVVRIEGRDHYLGPYDSPESHAEYRRIVGEWLALGVAPSASGPVEGSTGPAAPPTVGELILGYVRHADAYYVKDGRPTSEASLIRLSLRVLNRQYGHTPARDFGPMALKAVRQTYIDSGLCRREVNRRTGHVVRLFRWAVENERVPASAHHGLKAVAGLRKGRAGVRETEPVRPVSDPAVDAVRPFVSRQVWAMIELQRLTGMRPGEVCGMRTLDVDMSGQVWVYTPESHKTEHHGRERRIFLGPAAQAVLAPWLKADREAYIFSPREAMEERRADLRKSRKTPVQPSQRCRRKRAPKRQPGRRYTKDSYRRAIATACEKAGAPHWHPHQLRHSAATRIRKEFGLDVARTVLGHSSPTVTAVYAEADHEKARAVMSQAG